MSDKKTYRIAYKCSNCGNKWIEDKPFGKEAKPDEPCNHCGCKKGDPNPAKFPKF
jgi:DNA-directed RNA polymerase subunit RPC12/RpoP